MASVRVPLTTFERGDLLPMVCAVTGTRAEREVRLVVSRVPGWVWFLVPLTLVFIPVYVFSMERVVGRVPVTRAVYRSVLTLTIVRTTAVVAAVLVLLSSLLLEPVPGAFSLLAVVFAAIALVATGRRRRMWITGRFDPAGDGVILGGVAPTFADAVDQLQPFLL